MFTIIVVIVVIVVLAIIGEIFGIGGASSSRHSTIKKHPNAPKNEYKKLDVVKENSESAASQEDFSNFIFYSEIEKVKDKINYYQKLIDSYHSLPILEGYFLINKVSTKIFLFSSKLKVRSLSVFMAASIKYIINYNEIKGEFDEIKSMLTVLDSLFSVENKKKKRDYVANMLEQYGVSTINHMTHIDNLSSILGNGLISHNNPYCKRDISNQGVNARRERIEPIYNKKIHDYVPFYMNIRNPMLYVVQKQQGDDIVILGYSPDILFEKNILFTDRNAATNAVRFTGDAFDLGNKNFINMDRVFNIHGETLDKELKHIMQAEILVPEKVEIFLSKIYVQNEAKKNFIENEYKSLLKERNITVVVDEDLFF